MNPDQIHKPVRIGVVTKEVIKLTGYGHTAGVILIGPGNIRHMKERHLDEFDAYFPYIEDILAHPDYAGINPNDQSLQFIKEFSDRVLVGVRLSNSGTYFVRTLYKISETKFENYMKSGRLVRISK